MRSFTPSTPLFRSDKQEGRPENVLNIPVLRWGQPYQSLELAEVSHFLTGEPIAKFEPGQRRSGATRHAQGAAGAQTSCARFPATDLIERLGKAAELYERGTLPLGDGTQSPDDFVHQQSATTGLPEHMCRANMAKNAFVLQEHGPDPGLPDARPAAGDPHPRLGRRRTAGVIVSYQAQSPVLGAVLPSNSPGVHTLWLPADPAAAGPGAQARFAGAVDAVSPGRRVHRGGHPQRRSFALYPGGHDVGTAVLNSCPRAMIFGSAQTVEQYQGQSARAGPRAGVLQDPAGRRCGRPMGRSTWT